jgi:hypothetical protein
MHVLSPAGRWGLVIAGFVFAGSSALGAPPLVKHLFPAGGQRGERVAVAAAGDFPRWPVQAWVDRPGLTITCDQDKGKLSVAIDRDAVPGIYWLRLHDADGASALRPFVVGTLPELGESEPNDAPATPQAIERHVVINGRLGKSNDVDGFAVELAAGQTLVASLQANSTLGAPMDAVLQVCELVDRAGLRAESPSPASAGLAAIEAYVITQNHDAVGLDPLLAFTAPKAGRYLVRLFAFPATPDSSIRFAGGDDYLYRLTLTTGRYIDHCLPLAVGRETSEVRLFGWNLGEGVVQEISPVVEPAALAPPEGLPVAIWRPDAAGALFVPRVDHPAIDGSEWRRPPSGTRAGDLPLPATVSGRFDAAGEQHRFPFAAEKDQKLRFRVEARSLGYPTDAVLAIRDEAGRVLAEVDDSGRDERDPQLEFTAPAAGRYQLVVRDLHDRAGVRLVYRLTAGPVAPDFSLGLAADSFVLEKDKPLELPVTVSVRDGLRESITLTVRGLPDGVTAEPVVFQPSADRPSAGSGTGRRGRRGGGQPPSGPSAKLILKSDGKAAYSGPIVIEGRVGGAVARSAAVPLNLPLAGTHWAAWLTVRK